MNRDDIKEFIELLSGYKYSSRMLAEAGEDDEEDPFADDDEGGDDEGGDDEGGDEEGEEGEEEEEEEVKVDKSDEVEFGKSLDDSLTALFVDIETDALKSAKIQEEGLSLRNFLLEAEDPAIDLEIFAAETARIIKNADVLLDIESIILSKARDYLLNKYGEDQEKDFMDIMHTRFSIDARAEAEKEKEEEVQAPIAVGAGGEGGGAA